MPEGFGLYGKDTAGKESSVYWHTRREVVERVLSLNHFQSKGYTDLEIRESDGENSNHAKAHQMAMENAARGRPIKKMHKQHELTRQAVMPDTRFVNWGEFKRAVERDGTVWDTDPVAIIRCEFPVDLDGEPELTIGRDDMGIVTIGFKAQE